MFRAGYSEEVDRPKLQVFTVTAAERKFDLLAVITRSRRVRT